MCEIRWGMVLDINIREVRLHLDTERVVSEYSTVMYEVFSR